MPEVTVEQVTQGHSDGHPVGTSYVETVQVGTSHVGTAALGCPAERSSAFLASALLQRRRKRIQRKRPQQIPPHPAFHVSQPVGRRGNPLKISRLTQPLQL